VFFDEYPLFFETSKTVPSSNRLGLRHIAMIQANRDILAGARVLDLASHDGRWSFAALHAGASHVTGVEARQPLVDNAYKTFAEYGVDGGTYDFICGDMFEVLKRQRFEVDVVLCLGFLYHTLRYPELLQAIRRISPKYCVIDTKVIVSDEPELLLKENRTERQSHAAADDFSHGTKALAAWPSIPAVHMMMDLYDFELESTFDWEKLLRESDTRAGLRDYTTGNRFTARYRSR
jgi:cyclopropane fatty-acyl-phospholipid synthase-like methyltransferase